MDPLRWSVEPWFVDYDVLKRLERFCLNFWSIVWTYNTLSVCSADVHPLSELGARPDLIFIERTCFWASARRPFIPSSFLTCCKAREFLIFKPLFSLCCWWQSGQGMAGCLDQLRGNKDDFIVLRENRTFFQAVDGLLMTPVLDTSFDPVDPLILQWIMESATVYRDLENCRDWKMIRSVKGWKFVCKTAL